MLMRLAPPMNFQSTVVGTNIVLYGSNLINYGNTLRYCYSHVVAAMIGCSLIRLSRLRRHITIADTRRIIKATPRPTERPTAIELPVVPLTKNYVNQFKMNINI